MAITRVGVWSSKSFVHRTSSTTTTGRRHRRVIVLVIPASLPPDRRLRNLTRAAAPSSRIVVRAVDVAVRPAPSAVVVRLSAVAAVVHDNDVSVGLGSHQRGYDDARRRTTRQFGGRRRRTRRREARRPCRHNRRIRRRHHRGRRWTGWCRTRRRRCATRDDGGEGAALVAPVPPGRMEAIRGRMSSRASGGATTVPRQSTSSSS